ncbi:MAG: cyclic nucleotide-binding domain-containing protein [Bacteroidota bacterium]
MKTFASYLKQTEIFHQFTRTQLETVADLCREAAFSAGELIFPANSSSTELYIITAGEVDILIGPGTGEAPGPASSGALVARLRRGQSFGEVALVDEGLRSASARAVHDGTRLLVIPRDKLIMLCETYPALGFRLMYNLAADLAMKIRNTDLRIREELLSGVVGKPPENPP